MPVPGTITPDPAPVDADSDAAFPSPSMTEMCVVPAGDATSVGAASPVCTRAQPGAKRVVSEQAPGEPTAVELRCEPRVPHATLLAHHLDEESDLVSATGVR